MLAALSLVPLVWASRSFLHEPLWDEPLGNAGTQGVALCVASLLVGSFLTVVIVRLPAGRPFVLGRSACPHCGHVLTTRDLVPVLSWMINSGRCRHCAARVSIMYPLVEISAVAVALSAAALVPPHLLAMSCVLGWTLLALTAIDLREGLLPDRLTLPLMVAGVLLALALAPETWMDHLLGAIAGFSLFAAVATVYRHARGREGLGGGDAKLLAAAGAWVTWQGLPGVVLIASVSGLALLLVRSLAGAPIGLSDRIAFGPHLALATWLVWLYGPPVLG
jgi:leader peptidase (prepilin peptidase)/N-methyltransferase